ncbi:MAG: asparagine synthase (glutamine-hydrolyzing), partial [Phycisphaerae bacterium]|nr:asparagine synthase (glutamine-hydrolyzing) [Phycisphaerae bacterium]
MCGFAGVIAYDERYRTSRQTLARMSAAIAHRGPDGEGSYFNHDSEVTRDHPQCALAFRRLAVLDPDPRSMQPFTIGAKTLVFNGEIYNFRELRKELTHQRPDYSWRTAGDAEVLLLSFDIWGTACLEKLNGMFAFAIWDEANCSLFLARDRMGQKPLYYTANSQRLAFASELAALRCLPFWNEINSIDDASLIDYLNAGYVHADRTIYHHINNLMPSTWLSGTSHAYFDRSKTSDELITATQTRRLVETAVERQLVSDVPLGVFLSGGIDSSIIAACARQHGPVDTFSIGSDDPRYDETIFAEQVANHLETHHHAFHVRPDAADALPLIAKTFGEPMADSSALPTYYLARETRAHVTVALSGDGGDELFGGYDRYRALQMTERMPVTLRNALAKVGTVLPQSHPKSSLSRLRRLLHQLDRPASERYAGYVELFDRQMISALLGRPIPPSSIAELFDQIRLTCGLDPVQTAAALDRIEYLPNDLLTKVDRCSMLRALEVRSPFMDHELVSFATGLTTDDLLRGGGKRMLRDAFADDLPASVFNRRKMGFAVPIGEWFRRELRPMLRDHLFAADSFIRQRFDVRVVQRIVDEHERGRIDHSQRLYALLMLELWA